MNTSKTVDCGYLRLTVDFPEDASKEEIEDLEAVLGHFKAIGKIINEAVKLYPSYSELLYSFGIFLFDNTCEQLEIYWPNEEVAEVSDAVWLYDLDEISTQTLLDIVLTLNETSPESLDFHTREIPFAATISTPYLRYVLAFRYC